MSLLTRQPTLSLLGAVAMVVVAAGCGGGKSSHGVAGVHTMLRTSARSQIVQNWVASFMRSFIDAVTHGTAIPKRAEA